jgi:hypothetical protein
MRVIVGLGVFAIFAMGSGAQVMRAQDNAADLQKKLNAEFTLTKVTADRSDIVTAGSVLVLHKDGLVMYSTPTETSPMNTYKDGQIQVSQGSALIQLGLKWIKGGGGSAVPSQTPQHKFVSGEKFWVTGIAFQSDAVVFAVYSEPFDDVRYYGQLKFPFPKNSMPSSDSMVRAIEEVITVAPADNGDSGPQQSQNAPAPAQPATPPEALAPIAPPPPPADQPAAQTKTIAVGQTRDQVIDTWGQPTKDIKLATKEILIYPDMKVTFVAGKVSGVQ